HRSTLTFKTRQITLNFISNKGFHYTSSIVFQGTKNSKRDPYGCTEYGVVICIWRNWIVTSNDRCDLKQPVLFAIARTGLYSTHQCIQISIEFQNGLFVAGYRSIVTGLRTYGIWMLKMCNTKVRFRIT